jgi:hypothetical protein
MDLKPLPSIFATLAIGTIVSVLAVHPGIAGAADSPKTSAPDWTQPPGLALGCDGPILALAVLPDERLVVGGRFRNCGGVAAANVALWDPQLGIYLPLGAGIVGGAFGTPAVVTAIAADANDIVVGGGFTTAGGAAAANLARYRFASQGWEPLGPSGSEGVNAEVTAVARSGDTLFVGGAFVRAGGVAARHLARFSFATDTWSALPAPQPAAIVRALAIADGALFVGGDARLLQQATTSPISRFDLGTSTWSTVASFDGRVNALTVSGRALYVGGSFTGSGGAPLGRIARIDLNTLEAAAMGAGITGGSFFGTAVTALAATAAEVYVVGNMTVVGGGASGGGVARNIARFDRSTARWSSIGVDTNNGMDSPGLAVVVSGERGYVAGGFGSAGGAPSRGVAAFSPTEALFRDGFETLAR